VHIIYLLVALGKEKGDIIKRVFLKIISNGMKMLIELSICNKGGGQVLDRHNVVL
jgi:hypothetical protein